MTFKLNPIIEKIESPVVIRRPGGATRQYKDGKDASADTFDKNYQIKAIHASDSTVVIEMVEVDVPVVNWTGEKQSFF